MPTLNAFKSLRDGANFGNALAVAGLDMAINDLHGACAE